MFTTAEFLNDFKASPRRGPARLVGETPRQPSSFLPAPASRRSVAGEGPHYVEGETR